MAMFVKSRRKKLFVNSKNDKWQKFCDACVSVRKARKYMKARRAKITVCRGVLDYNAKRPEACFVQYESVVFPGISVQNAKFMSVCSDMGKMGLCRKCGDCSMKLDNIMYNWAVKKLEIEKGARRQYLNTAIRGSFWIPKKIAQFRRYKWLKTDYEAKTEAHYSYCEIGMTDMVAVKQSQYEWDYARKLMQEAREELLGRGGK